MATNNSKSASTFIHCLSHLQINFILYSVARSDSGHFIRQQPTFIPDQLYSIYRVDTTRQELSLKSNVQHTSCDAANSSTSAIRCDTFRLSRTDSVARKKKFNGRAPSSFIIGPITSAKYCQILGTSISVSSAHANTSFILTTTMQHRMACKSIHFRDNNAITNIADQ